MERVAKGTMVSGVLAPVWPLVAKGADISKAYPDELISIEVNTRGRIKPGDVITQANVDAIKHLIDPVLYDQIVHQGRRIKIGKTTTDPLKLFPYPYYEATLANAGRGKFDASGNVVDSQTGDPWIGGNPFPDPKSAEEAVANITLSWGRHDISQYAIRSFDINPDGTPTYTYDFSWVEMNAAARCGKVKYFQNNKDMLRYQSIWFTSPQEQAGTSFLSRWYYDQRKFPDLYGYLPQFRRTRQFPANQRFEPLVPGTTLFLSDAWGAGDPMNTWGNYKVIGREPRLVPMSGNWWGARHPNWEAPRHGGPKGLSFMDTTMELVPETMVIEGEPTGYPRAPVGKKKLWLDVRNSMVAGYLTFDRRGSIWKYLEGSFGQKVDGNAVWKDKSGHPHWSWNTVTVHDVQSRHISLLTQVKEITGGYHNIFETDNEQAMYDRYLTQSAIGRLGSV